MAIIKSIGVGRAKGSVGEFTYSTVEGRTIARSKPAFVSNPNTRAQQSQRTKMTNIVFLWSKLGQRFDWLWTKKAKYNSAYNAFVSANVMKENTYEVDIENNSYQLKSGFIFSRGQFPSDSIIAKELASGSGVEIDPDGILFPQLKDGDRYGIIYLNAAGQVIAFKEDLIDDVWIDNVKKGYPIGNFPIIEVAETLLGFWISKDGRKSTSVTV